jgi:hypothetical protein
MRSRVFPIIGFGLFLLAGTGHGQDKEKGDLRKALNKAVKTSAALKSYSFQIDERPGQGSAGVFQGKYEQGKPIFFLADKIELFKKGEVLVYKDQGKWERSRTGRLSDPLRVLGAVAKVRGARLPHEELPVLAKALTGIKLVEVEPRGTVYAGVYQGELKEADARRLVPKSLEQVAQKGQAKIWVGLDGQVHKYSLTIPVQGRQGNVEINGKVTRSVLLTDRGTAKITVPDEAKKALDK